MNFESYAPQFQDVEHKSNAAELESGLTPEELAEVSDYIKSNPRLARDLINIIRSKQDLSGTETAAFTKTKTPEAPVTPGVPEVPEVPEAPAPKEVSDAKAGEALPESFSDLGGLSEILENEKNNPEVAELSSSIGEFIQAVSKFGKEYSSTNFDAYSEKGEEQLKSVSEKLANMSGNFYKVMYARFPNLLQELATDFGSNSKDQDEVSKMSIGLRDACLKFINEQGIESFTIRTPFSGMFFDPTFMVTDTPDNRMTVVAPYSWSVSYGPRTLAWAKVSTM